MQSLIDRFDELIVSPLPPPGTEGAATGAPADESKGEAPADEAAAAHRQALEAATRSLTGHDMALAKLRSHFQKASCGPLECGNCPLRETQSKLLLTVLMKRSAYWKSRS